MEIERVIFLRTAGVQKLQSLRISGSTDPRDICESIEDYLTFSSNQFYALVNGIPVSCLQHLNGGEIIDIHGKINGGKGGFGSMLRAIGAQIEKTTNREACRDLSGRRLRAINDERRYHHFAKKKIEHDRDRETKRRKKLESMARDKPKHEFKDEEYFREKEAIPDRVEDAVEAAFNEEGEPSSSGVKRTAGSDRPSKKLKGWFGDTDMSEDSEDGSSNEDSQQASSSSAEGKQSDDESCQEASPEVKNEVLHLVAEEEPKVEKVSAKKQEVVNKVSDETAAKMDAPEKAKVSKSEKEDSAVSKPCVPAVDVKEVDLESSTGVDQLLQDYTPDDLKHSLMRRNIKCGGSRRERAERLWSIKGLTDQQIPKKLLAKK